MPINHKITEAVTDTNVTVLGEAPAEAMGMSNTVMSHAVGLAMENATQAQGSMQQLANSSTMGSITRIMEAAAKSLDSSSSSQ